MCVSVFAVKLSAWERDDDAIKEHYKWSPECEYIKMVEHPRHKNRDSQDLDRVHPLSEALDWGPVTW